MLATTADYSQRIDAGKKVESKILDALRKLGHSIDNPTADQDKWEKIDGWWHGTKGGLFPIQVKFRETGDDILFELIKDIDKKIQGRDIISKAVVYLVTDRSGTTRMILTKPIKEKAAELLKIAEKDMANDPYKTFWRGDKWEMRMQVDHAHGQRKLVAYFKPELFDILKTWNLQIH